MQRLLGEILAIDDRRPREGAAGDLTLRVRILGPAQPALRLPEGVRGKTTTITRTALRDDQFAAGARLVLSASESSLLLAPEAPGDELPATGRRAADYNRDGFVEQRLGNPFVRLDVEPSYGGRIASLQLRRRAVELFARPVMPSEEGPVLGGFADGLAGSGPGDLSCAEYQLAEAHDDEVIVARDLSGPFKGAITRAVRLEPDAPLIRVTTAIRRAWDADAAKKQRAKAKRLASGELEDDDDPEEREPLARYEPRLYLRPGEAPPAGRVELLLPTSGGLRRTPWEPYLWQRERPAAAGWLACVDPDLGAGLLLLFSPARIESAGVAYQQEPGFIALGASFHPAPLKLGEQVTEALALVAAEAIDACAAGVAALCVGQPGEAGQPVSVLTRGAPAKSTVHAAGREWPVPWSDVVDRRLGAWRLGRVMLPEPVSGHAEVCFGEERMVLPWSA